MKSKAEVTWQAMVLTSFCLFKLATVTKVDVTVKCQLCVMEISIIVTDVIKH